jgi:hypothetical protein
MEAALHHPKRVVIVHWKNNTDHPFEVFSSLKNFCLSYQKYNYNTLSNYLSKNKIAYDNRDVRIERKNVFLKPKTNTIETGRSIQPVLRKVPMKDADDYKHDVTYWLAKLPAERLSAVTSLIRQTMEKGQRLDKSKIVKRKLRA